jgi:2-polyprenyl-6-hydroxyphenyl methylase/3-demethylubiquinone-9 3-methyltransferase
VNDAVYFHSQGAATWELNYTKRAFLRRKEILRELLAATDLTGQSWLDAGCGTGHLARCLAEYKGCHVLGVDASEAMISHCVPHPNTDFRQIGDIGETGLPDAAFDGVLCSSVLEYVSEPSAALFELRRVLKQNGMLLVSVSNSDPIAWFPIVLAHRLTKHLGPWRMCQYLDYFKHRYSELTFRRLLDRCGFRVEAVRTYGGVRGFPVLGRGTLTMFRAVKL